MIIKLQNSISEKDKQNIINTLLAKKYKTSEVKTQSGNYIVAIGNYNTDIRTFGKLKGVLDIFRVPDTYKFVSSKWKINPTEIKINKNISIGGRNFTIIAGPCSIENENQVTTIAKHLVNNNIKFMRGGVFKPRSSPYTFRGLGLKGLKMFHQIAKEYNLKIITEVMEISQIPQMYEYVDIFQIGTRNSQNFNLLAELGKINKPVMIKRALSGTIDELLQSAEYIFSSGNEKIILCERGIRTFENAYRNTLDLNAVAILKEKSHLPVIVDPSHGVGIRNHIIPMSLASVMAGADGIMVEIHPIPEEAKSDGQQTLNLQEAEDLYNKLNETVKLRNKILLHL